MTAFMDIAGQPLAGAGIGNGNFTTGEEYTINKVTAPTITETFKSNGRYDGWVIESRETSNRGRYTDKKANTFILGDDNGNRQYRAILDFSTDSLPDNAVITRALLMIQGAGLVGTNPFETHQDIQVDIRSGSFGAFGPFSFRGLQSSDFQARSSKDAVGLIQNNPYERLVLDLAGQLGFPIHQRVWNQLNSACSSNWMITTTGTTTS